SNPDAWAIFGTNTAGILPTGTPVEFGAFQGATPNFTVSTKYLDITETTSGRTPNVLLNSLNVTSSTPEPATFGLIGAALAGLGLLRRKKVARG
ncbi:MAG: PEP-CTERM sorting domain-containing protein, partial [Bryobacteraceae bacterium]